jgi:hypothetical protein
LTLLHIGGNSKDDEDKFLFSSNHHYYNTFHSSADMSSGPVCFGHRYLRQSFAKRGFSSPVGFLTVQVNLITKHG